MNNKRTALVCGASGFLATHLIKRLVRDGFFVRAISRSMPRWGEPTAAHDYLTMDLRYLSAEDPLFAGVDEVYQMAATAGSIAMMEDHDLDAKILRDNALINLHVLEACRHHKVGKVFFPSTACMYPSNETRASKESDAFPLQEDTNAYAWEKVFSEKLYASYRKYGLKTYIGRYHSTYGPYIDWRGVSARAPAALCRKVAEAENFTGEIEMWGDGGQTRSFMYVDDAVEGTMKLVRSDFFGPVNIGSAELVTLDQLAHTIMMVAKKTLTIKHVQGVQGVRGRSSDNALIREKLGWTPSIALHRGLVPTYAWVAKQVELSKAHVDA